MIFSLFSIVLLPPAKPCFLSSAFIPFVCYSRPMIASAGFKPSNTLSWVDCSTNELLPPAKIVFGCETFFHIFLTLTQWLLQQDSNPQTHDQVLIVLHIIISWLFYHCAIATGKTLFFIFRFYPFCLLFSPNDCFSRIQTIKHIIMSWLFYHWAIATGKHCFWVRNFFPYLSFSHPMIA